MQPKDAERVLNGYAMRTRRRIAPEAQTALALTAFAGNGFLVLVGNPGGPQAGPLPYEGDRVLGVILSKAIMLADDTRITDPTILSQL